MVMTPRQIDDMLLDNSNKTLGLVSKDQGYNLDCVGLVSSVRDRIELGESISGTGRKFKDSGRF